MKLNALLIALLGIGLTPQKKVVWALREWTNPDLGASSIQLLDEPGKAENGDLQR